MILVDDGPHAALLGQARKVNGINAPGNRIRRRVCVDVDDAFERPYMSIVLGLRAASCKRGAQQEHKLNSLHENLSEPDRDFRESPGI